MSVAIDPSVSVFLRNPHSLLINGESRPARSGAGISLYDPATDTELTRMAHAGTEGVDRTVVAARRAFEGNWAGQRPADHEHLLLRLAGRIEAYGEQLAQLETLSSGKSVNLSRALEVSASVEFIRYMAGWAVKIKGRSPDLSIAAIPSACYRAYTVLEPIGVVGVITPWNFPLLMVTWKITPALACSCTVVLKPADEALLVALRLDQLCLEAGIPPGVVNVATGTDAEAGAALAARPGTGKLTFIGSTPMGKLIRHAAVRNMVRFSLEPGGRSPMVILNDTNLDMATADSAGAIFFNQGQVCTAGSCLYVQRKRFDRVLECLAAIADDLSINPGLDPTAQINLLVSARQRERVLGVIESGVTEGASVACGGAHQGEMGFYVQPAILADVIPGMQVVCKEIFGPMLVTTPFDGFDETICLVNDSICGFGASIWSNDLRQVMDLMSRIKASMVWMNAHNLFDPSMPFGGFKQSGIGREVGHAAIGAYTESKSVCTAY